MPKTIPESHVPLLTGPYYAILTTINRDGQPQNTVVWCSYDGEHVLVNATSNRQKTINVRHNPRVALIVLDPEDGYHWIDVRGYVAEIAPDVDNNNIDAHAKLYRGVDRYYGGVMPVEQAEKEQRVILKIVPESVVTVP